MQSSLIYFITRCTHSFEVPVKVSWTVVVPTFGMNEFTTSNPKSTMAVAMTATIYMPVPQDSPMAAVTHNPAAVVSPRTTFLWKMMVPAPKKPIPETTCAATREESFSSWPKPYCDTTQKRALPTATRKWVRKPASFERYSRSIPITPPKRNAMNSLREIS